MSLRKKLDELEAAVVRQYEALPAAERLSRSLAALAADDPGEAERLRESCAWRDYRMRDAAFTDRIEYCNFLAVAAAVDQRHAMGKLVILGLLAEEMGRLTDAHRTAALLGFYDGWAAASGTVPAAADDEADDDDDDEDDDKLAPALRAGLEAAGARADAATDALREVVEGVTEVVAAGLVAQWRALDRFCRRRLGTSAEVLMRAWGGGVADETLARVQAHAGVEPDAAVEAASFRTLEGQWTQRFGGHDGHA